MIRIMRNSPFSGTTSLPAKRPTAAELQRNATIERLLRERLPEGWSVERGLPFWAPHQRDVDVLVSLRGPEGQVATVAMAVRSLLEAHMVPLIAQQLRGYSPDTPHLVLAPYIAPSAQRALRENGVGYADLTGNLYLASANPLIFLSDRGADSDPWREERPLHSLRGPAAGRVVRALADFRPPYGIRELAERSDTPVASVSRVVTVLQREGLVDRSAEGGISDVRWRDMLLRWTQDYGLTRSNTVRAYIDPRGLGALVKRLPSVTTQYAVTGSLAAATVAPFAPARLATIYSDHTPALATELGLRLTDTGANVLLVAPFDLFVFERTRLEEGITFAALSQVAADLLTSPGRGPAEGEELLDWMEGHQDEWRS